MRLILNYTSVLLLFWWLWATHSYLLPNNRPSHTGRSVSYRTLVPSQRRTHTVALKDKLWDRLEIEEDPEPYWYLLNCVATNEIDLLRQCREICADMPDAIKFIVPTERKTRSHGANKMVTETKVKYPGYVFAKLRLCPQVYEAIQGLDLCRSWMGTVNHKGYRKLPPAPLALNELEVEKFGLEEWEDVEDDDEEDETGIIVDIEDEENMKSKVDEEAVKAFQGLKVGDMVKVTAHGNFFDEDGVVRRLKDGRIFVRFYTYGTMFEDWMDPSQLRKLNDLEVLKGLSGPTKPITQEEFDGPKRGYDRSYDDSRPGNMRRSLMGRVKGGGGGQRNRRQDRTADRFSRGRRADDENYRNDRNWNWYQDEQRRKAGSSASDSQWSMQAGSDQNRRNQNDDALSDVDSQWGRRKPQRQQRRERNRANNRRAEAAIDGGDDWSAFVSPASSAGGSAGSEKDTDDFFSSLMNDLSKDLDPKKASESAPWSDRQIDGSPDTSEQDAFFDSLASELPSDVRNDPAHEQQSASRSSPKSQSSNADEDFFSSLEAELGSALGDDDPNDAPARRQQAASRAPPKSQSRNTDKDFFSSLEAELESSFGTSSSSTGESGSEVASDDFFSQLDAEFSHSDASETGDSGSIDGFLSDLFDDLGSEQTSGSESQTTTAPKTSPSATSGSSSAAEKDPATSLDPASLSKCTVPVLKTMLREKGLKVSGKKSDLIERLANQE